MGDAFIQMVLANNLARQGFANRLLPSYKRYAAKLKSLNTTLENLRLF